MVGRIGPFFNQCLKMIQDITGLSKGNPNPIIHPISSKLATD
jgi:hypothetical protein